jgi:hypothetical protein
MRLVSTLFLCLLGSTAMAQQCDRWEASMEEDEGGPVMMASICARTDSSDPAEQHYILVQCGPDDGVSIRYLPFAGASYPPGGNEEYKTKLEFSLAKEKFTVDAHYEAMDGALVMNSVNKSSVTILLKQKRFMLSDVNSDKVPVVTFTLNGATEAFEELSKTCGQ